MIKLPKTDEELLRECTVDTFRAGGPGGQHVNKTETAVRLTHLPSGIAVTSREERSQYRNKRLCLEKLRRRIEQLNFRPAKRHATRARRGARNRTLAAKAKHSLLKKLRSTRITEE